MKQVRAIGDYSKDSYCIHDMAGIRYLVQANPTPDNIRAEIPVLCINTCSEPRLLDEQTCRELEVPEKDICRQLYRTIKAQAESDANFSVSEEEDEDQNYDSDDEASSESCDDDSGNGSSR